MNVEAITLTVVIEIAFVVVSVAVAWGVLRTRVTHTEKQLADERREREKLSDRLELYVKENVGVQRELASIQASMQSLIQRFDRLESKIDTYNGRRINE